MNERRKTLQVKQIKNVQSFSINVRKNFEPSHKEIVQTVLKVQGTILNLSVCGIQLRMEGKWLKIKVCLIWPQESKYQCINDNGKQKFGLPCMNVGKVKGAVVRNAHRALEFNLGNPPSPIYTNTAYRKKYCEIHVIYTCQRTSTS